jgi:hypothetical protein
MQHIARFALLALLTAIPAVAQNKTSPYTGIAWPANCNVSGTVAYNFLTDSCFAAGSVAPIVYRSTWSGTTTYAVNDAVAYGGNQWISILSPNLNQTPGSAPTYWSLLLTGGGGGGSGTVTTVSISPGNGFQGSVANATTTPAISINVDSTHVLPVNTGSATTYLNGAGSYSTPAAGGITAVTGNNGLTCATSSGAVTCGISNTVSTNCVSGICYNAFGLVTGPPFTFSFSCSASGTYEAGNATANPNTCTFTSYAGGTAASGTLTDSQSHTGTFVSPFSSGTLAYQYCTVVDGVSSQTFTGSVTASNGQTYSQNAGTNCLPREFGGVASSGATGATASGTSALLTGPGTTIGTAGLGQQGTWGPYTASGQYIYILGTGNSCSFTSGGFSFLMNSPISFTFTNQYTAPIAMYLYRSVNSQTGSFTLVGNC